MVHLLLLSSELVVGSCPYSGGFSLFSPLFFLTLTLNPKFFLKDQLFKIPISELVDEKTHYGSATTKSYVLNHSFVLELIYFI